MQDLPEIWEQLVEAGFESGHAYGKALRTVKSCVGTTWCRYGVQDSVGFADPRRESLQGHSRAAQDQDGRLGLRARMRRGPVQGLRPRSPPRTATTSMSAATAAPSRATPSCWRPISTRRPPSRYIDRFLAYYISTADKLTRTSVWLEKLEGGIDHVRDVDRRTTSWAWRRIGGT